MGQQDEFTVSVVCERLPDGGYQPAVAFGEDVRLALPQDRAIAYALVVISAAQRADHLAAVAKQLSKAGAIEPAAVAATVVGLRAQLPALDDAAAAPFRFEPRVNIDLSPIVGVHVGDQYVGPWDPAQAGGHAVNVLTAISAAQSDATYLRYLTETIGLPEASAQATVWDVANHRWQRDQSSEPLAPCGDDEVHTAEQLAQVLAEHGAPPRMVYQARRGYYHDYLSPLATPCLQLVADLTAVGLPQLAQRAKEGEFDASKAESDAWAASPDGRATFRTLARDVTAGGGEGDRQPPGAGKATGSRRQRRHPR